MSGQQLGSSAETFQALRKDSHAARSTPSFEPQQQPLAASIYRSRHAFGKICWTDQGYCSRRLARSLLSSRQQSCP